MPDLINDVILKGGKVSMHLISGKWKDLGHMSDYKEAMKFY